VLKVRVGVRRAEVRVLGVGRLRRGSEQAICGLVKLDTGVPKCRVLLQEDLA